MLRRITQQDLHSIPGYRTGIDPKTVTVKRVLFPYSGVQIECGFVGAHMHNEGLVIEFTDGSVTNVGHVCGAKALGGQLKDAHREYVEKIIRPPLAAKLARTQARIADLQSIRKLADEGKALAKFRTDLLQEFPHLARELKERAARRDPVVTTPVERSRQEVEDYIALNPGTSTDAARFKHTIEGSIAGLGLFKLDLTKVLKLASRSEELPELQINKLSLERLQDWARWCDELDDELMAARRSISDCEGFTELRNLRLLSLLSGPANARRRLAVGDLYTHNLRSAPTLPKGWSDGRTRRAQGS